MSERKSVVRKTKSNKSPHNFKSLLFKISIVLFVFLIAVGIYYAIEVTQFFAEIRDIEGDYIEEEEFIMPKEKEPTYARTNILLLGIDARTPREPSRSDTIMVLSLNDKTQEASLLSIPRDSRVNIPGRGLDKIGHAHAFGGVSLTIATVEEFLDVPIHYYARVNFWGFQRIIEALGGVTLNVESHVARNYPELQSGTHRLDGTQALIYVRHRRTDSDIGRVKRQQKLLMAIARESYSIKTLTRLPQILDSAGEHLRTNIPANKMLQVANLFLRVELDTIPQGVIPGKAQTIDRKSYWVVDSGKMEQLLEELGLKGERSQVPSSG